jgi:hypothetical protein
MAHSIHQKITTIINEHAHVPAVLPAASLFLFGVVWLLFLPLASPRNGRGKKCRYPGDKLDQTGSLSERFESSRSPGERGRGRATQISRADEKVNTRAEVQP